MMLQGVRDLTADRLRAARYWQRYQRSLLPISAPSYWQIYGSFPPSASAILARRGAYEQVRGGHCRQELPMSLRTARAASCACGSASLCHLTDRQVDLLVLAAAGKSSVQIGHTLGISARTVNDHVDIMMRRADAANRVELIARAYASGILISGAWPPISSANRCLRLIRP